MFPRFLAVVLVAVVVILSARSFAFGAGTPFRDISDSQFKSDIEWLYLSDVTHGCATDRYCPNDPVTRGQMASFLGRMFKLPAAVGDYFVDDSRSLFQADINRLAQAGITSGCGNGRYCPEQHVTRAEMASFLARARGLNAGAGTDYFYDDNGSIHQSNINRLAHAGLTAGCGQGRFCPEAAVTRGQMAAFLRRVESPIDAPIPTPDPPPSTSPPVALPAGALHVAPWGSDSNPGTASAPWRTLQRAANTVSPGAKVAIRAGTYAPFAINRSGTGADPIVFTGYPGDAAPVVAGTGSTRNVIEISAAHHVTISNLIVQGAEADKSGAGIRIDGGAYEIAVVNSVLRSNRSYGVHVTDATSIRISGNEVSENAEGIYIGGGTADVVVSENRVHHNNRLVVNTPDPAHDDHGAVGISFVKTSGPVLAVGNLIWGNRAPSHDYGYDGGAFEIFGASNVSMIGNTMWDNRNVLETGTRDAPCANNVFARNVVYGATTVDRSVGMVLRCAENMEVANNTFHNLDQFVFTVDGDPARFAGSIDGLQIVNNIAVMASGKIYGIESALPTSVVIDANLVYSSAGGSIGSVVGRGSTNDLATFTSWTGRETGGIQADPQFVDDAGLDFRLAADSPAIDRGLMLAGVTDSFAGAAPDIGRFENGP